MGERGRLDFAQRLTSAPAPAPSRAQVGTETLVDKSKSTKTVLMQLFPGNTNIEGAWGVRSETCRECGHWERTPRLGGGAP